MPREKQDYRVNLEMIKEKYPDRITISITEASKLLKRCRRSLLSDEDFPARKIAGKYEVPIAGLARFLS